MEVAKKKSFNLSKMRNFFSITSYYAKVRLEAESSRNYAGYLWWILDPLMAVFIYYILFKKFMNRGGDDYMYFLFLGLTLWKWFSDTTVKSASSILNKLTLIRKINIPKIIFPITEVFYNTWKSGIVLIFILCSYFLLGYDYSLKILFVPYLFFVFLIFITGVSVFCSSIIPFSNDLNFFITYVLRLGFYPSGILFDETLIPEKFHIYLQLNPIAGLVKSFRNVIMYDKYPDFFRVNMSMLLGIVFLYIGYRIIKKYEQEYPKIL